jgi:hypothetical protein
MLTRFLTGRSHMSVLHGKETLTAVHHFVKNPSDLIFSLSLCFSSPRARPKPAAMPSLHAAAGALPELHRRTQMVRLVALFLSVELIEQRSPETPPTTASSPQTPSSPPPDSPSSGFPRPCRPCGRPRGEPPRLLPCPSSPRSPCSAAGVGRPAPCVGGQEAADLNLRGRRT